MHDSTHIGFIGAGNMAEAMAGALISSGSLSSRQLTLCDVKPERLRYLERQHHVLTTEEAAHVFSEADTVILAVKPQSMKPLLTQLTAKGLHHTLKRKQIITIAAGLPLSCYEAILYEGLSQEERSQLPIMRVMPNTPSLVRSGMSGLCGNDQTTQEDLEQAEKILSSMGRVLRVKESQMDAVTAISGSGPAYFFYVVETMVKAAQELGFSEEEATLLASNTLRGAAHLLCNSLDSPAELRKKVTSPGGTTEAALTTMEKERVAEGIQKGIRAAAKRSKELSELI